MSRMGVCVGEGRCSIICTSAYLHALAKRRPIIFRRCSKFSQFTHKREVQRSFGSSLKCSSRPPSGMEMGDSEVRDKDFLLKNIALEISSSLRGSSLFLTGMAGSLKSTVGNTLSKALGYYFFDSEEIIEQASERHSATQNVREGYNEGFRDSESEVLRQLSSMGRLVVSTSDDVVMRTENLGLMRHGVIVWLDAPLEALAERILTDKAHRLGQSNNATLGTYPEVLERLTKSYEVRKEGYAVADIKIQLERIAGQHGSESVFLIRPTVIAIEVLNSLSKLLRYKKLEEAAAAPEIQ
eukprot:TRINITY_DN14065_c0_g1_i1.p1 TRINITY_DN14065_c0_g1~~TRINITY_DN14065_c0_g1_i1.p1  ORF type:complete len:297 (+),score=58.16 TRINITY_DN14065_c0_g1_i1:127-1017(+)